MADPKVEVVDAIPEAAVDVEELREHGLPIVPPQGPRVEDLVLDLQQIRSNQEALAVMGGTALGLVALEVIDQLLVQPAKRERARAKPRKARKTKRRKLE